MPDWAGDLHALGWATAIFLAVAHVVLWRWRSERLHFAANYAAIVIGGFSLISSAFQARAELAGVRYEMVTPRLDASRDRIREALHDTRHLLCDIHYRKSENSPANFDQLVAEQNVGCKAARRLIANSRSWITETDASIAVPAYGQEQAKLRFSKENFETIYSAVARYNEDAKVRQAYARQKRTSGGQIPLAVFGPFLAALAFSIALAALTFKPKAKAPLTYGGAGTPEQSQSPETSPVPPTEDGAE